jgi:hypothetical protein
VAQGIGPELNSGPQYCKNKNKKGLAWWVKSVILAIQEAEIGRIAILGQSRQKILETTCQPIKLTVLCMHLSFWLCGTQK